MKRVHPLISQHGGAATKKISRKGAKRQRPQRKEKEYLSRQAAKLAMKQKEKMIFRRKAGKGAHCNAG